jgi:hypothetical protein
MLLMAFCQNNQTFIFLKFVTRWWSQHEALNLFMSILFFSPLFPSWLHIAIECILFLLTMIKLFSLLNCQVFFPSSLLIITKLFFDLFNPLMLIDYISRGPKKKHYSHSMPFFYSFWICSYNHSSFWFEDFLGCNGILFEI